MPGESSTSKRRRLVKYPIMGEKATLMREKNNVLTFAVDMVASKSEIKEEVESSYKVKVVKVNTLITPKGIKKAHVKLDKQHSAETVISHFGIG